MMDKRPNTEPHTKAGIELDKFKRRLIRAVARLLLAEKKPENEVWSTLKKETGCDCQILWMRMRALTLKKLHRLFVANDCVKDIPKVARMSFTDWLLFDLVLVHQNVDVIGQNITVQNTKHDPKPLVELFELVKEFRIEGRRCESLAGAWSAATLKYNSQGHQCSPMLLQLRWYQLKEVTRDKFYNFWYAYRGTAKRLSLAEPHMPTCLQAAIATEFKDIVTSPFLEWEEMIQRRMVTLPEEFERKMMDGSVHRKPVANPNDDAPDLVVIEPHIETIDLGVESDNEDETNKLPENKEGPLGTQVKIKEEPIDMDMDIEETRVEEPPKKSIYDVVLESTAIEQENIDNIDYTERTERHITDDELVIEKNVIKEFIESTLKTQETMLPQITSVFGNVNDTSVLVDNKTLDNVDDTPVLTNTDNTLVLANETPIAKADDNTILDSVDNTLVLDKDDTTVLVSLDNTNIVNEDAPNVNINVGDTDILVHESNTQLARTEALSPRTNLIEMTDTDQDAQIEHNTFEPTTSASPMTEENRGLEMEDTSGSENTQREAIEVDAKPHIKECTLIEPFKVSNVNEDAMMAEDIVKNKLDEYLKPDITSFSFGELSNDINFVDDGIELVDDGIAYHDEDKHDDKNDGNVPKIDQKLLMCPIVYTTKLDDMGLLAMPFEHIEGKQLLDSIMSKNKPIKIVVIEEESSESDDSEDEVTDNQRVKLSSYMLQKPRSRSYNPIQLCKNPDFNTRLKRLTVGFFQHPRNRGLIKSCKPLTIDLSKAFESKLISGTLYLKPSDEDVKPEIIDDAESRQSVTVVPSAMPAQSLIDNSKIGDILPLLQSSEISSKPPEEFGSTCERNKVINLPDISEIRRINQRLLTAEVTPIQVQNSRIQVPVSIIASSPSTTTQSVEVARANIRAPPNIVDMTKDTSVKNNTEYNSDNNVNTFETLSTRRPLMDSSFYSGYNSRGRKKIGPAVSWKPRQIKPAIPWLSKNQEVAPAPFSSKLEDTLLTLDTLNKMLYLLSNDNEEPKSKQNKKKKGIPSQQPRKKQTAQPKPADNMVQCVSETHNTHTDEQTEPTKKCGKPKINIKSANNYRQKKQKQTEFKILAGKCNVAFHDLSESDLEDSEMSKDQQSDGNNKEVKYCCWARRKMLQLLFCRKRIPSHTCSYPLCTCCCRTLLEQYIVNDHKIKAAKMQNESTTPDELYEKDATDNSENVVIDGEVAVETPDHVPQEVSILTEGLQDSTPPPPAETPALDVEAVQDTSMITVTENEPIDMDAVESQDGVPTMGKEVSVPATSSVLPGFDAPQPSKSPDLPIDISINVTGPRITTLGPRKRKAIISQTHPTPQVVGNSMPTLRKVLAVKKTVTNTSGVPPLRKFKPFTPPKHFKEKMIFLNSKQISENPTDNPIFLGKNKILLTTIKFPPNLRKFEEAKQTLKSTLNIPNGVQLIFLPNGSVTYTIDHNIEVNATDLASMPAIIARLQAEINKPDPVIKLPEGDAVENEVVSLIDDDDDDDDAPKDTENKNVESSSEAEVPTIQVDETESTTNSPCDSSHIETEENLNNSNNENITDNTTETNVEENQVDQNAVPIQEDVRDSSQTEILSTSAENEQPATSSTEIREESTSEPSTTNKSKNILSDLMEMSGIFEEDITPTPEETVPAEAAEQQLVMANASVSTEQQEVVTANSSKSVEKQPIPPLRQLYVVPVHKISHENNTPPVIKSPLGELSPITSLYELKYACLNNGIFFKLDFETGYLVPINVCMKQQPKPVPKRIDPKSVIDLTEDDNDKGEPSPTIPLSYKSPDKRSLLIVNNVSNESVSPSKSTVPAVASTSSSQVKPVKLFRAVKPPILQRRLIQITPIDDVSNTVANMNENIDHKLKRKQFIRTVDWNYKDSDTAIAKQPAPKLYYRKLKRKIDDATANNYKGEDSLNKAETTPPELPKKQTEPNIGSDDSSDEEPLSNLAKRKRENEIKLDEQNKAHTEKQNDTQPANQNLVLSDKQNEAQPDEQNEVHPEVQNEVEIDRQKADSEDVSMSDNEPPEPVTHYELILEKDLAEEAEEEGQCILGV